MATLTIPTAGPRTAAQLAGDINGVVLTLGNLLMVAASLVPTLICSIRLDGRVDMEGVLRARLEVQVAEQAAEMAKRNDRIEALLTKLSEDVTAVRIQLGTNRRPAEPPAR